jgi:hypothetical protein
VTRADQQRHRRNGRGVRCAATLGAFTLTAVAITTGLGSGMASATGFGGTFSAVASADGVRVTVTMPHSALSNEVADGGGPSVQARIDSLGTSKAFASFPYPGDTAANAPGLVRTLSGGVPVPDLPFFVQSDHPIVPKQEAGTGPYLLRAQSEASRSAATASVGLASEGIGALGLARSEATVHSTAEAVISEATSTIESFFVGPLRLGHVVSHARVSLAPDGTRTQSGDTEVFGAMVGSTVVAFTPAGLRVGAADAALPDTAPLAEPLAAAGITVEVMPRKDLPTGVVAPAIRVTQKQQSGSQVVYVLGGASASGTGEAADTSAAAGVEGGPASPAPSEAGSSSGAAFSAGSGPVPVAADAAATPGDSSASSGDDAVGAAAGYPAGAAAVRYPTSFVVPEPAGMALGSVAAGPAQYSAPPTATAPAVSQSAASARRAAVVTAVLGTAVDVKPIYGTLIAGGILALGVAVVMLGLRPGGAR